MHIEVIKKNSLLLERQLIIFFPCALFLPMIITNVLTILLIFCFLLNNLIFRRKTKRPSVITFGFIFFYGLIFLSVLQGRPDFILVDLEKKLSMLIFPVIIANNSISKSDFKLAFRWFYSFAVLICLFIFISSVLDYLIYKNIDVFSNHLLSQKAGFHATYLSVYLLFSFTYPFFFERKRILKINWISTSLFFIGFIIILLGVRIVWMLFAFLFLILIFKWLSFEKNNKKNVFIIAGISFFLIGLFFFRPVNERFLELINYENQYSTKNVWGGRGIRILIWDSSKDLILQRPWGGYGSSTNVLLALEKDYKKKKKGPLLHMKKKGKRFNAHSQYFEEFLKYGVIIGFFYPTALLVLFITALKKENYFGVFLIIIIGVVSLTETIFELNKGIIFISFFLPFVFNNRNNKFVLN